ncbi:hypothetical protein HDE_00995 [Halotydeus destructor]|nr:hypothetical protein HDE_00995 [Halotydeus destructor]
MRYLSFTCVHHYSSSRNISEESLMSARVRTRFHGFKLEDIGCKVAIFDFVPSCTEVITSNVKIGDIDEHGNYSGLLGLIQRQDVDYAWAPMRLDCVTDSLGVLTPVSGADVRIVSPILNRSAGTENNVKYDNGSERFDPILETCASVDGMSYLFFCVAIFAIALIISIAKRRRQSDTSWPLAKNFTVTLWQIFEQVLNQGKFNPKATFVQLVWLMLTMGLFVIISGLFLNFLRTEKVAQVGPPQLESMESIVGSEFNRLEPTLMTNSFTFGLGKLVKFGSKEHKLFEKLRRHEQNLVYVNKSLDKGKDSLRDLMSLIVTSFANKDRYFLVEEILWSGLKPALCFSSPNLGSEAHTSIATLMNNILIIPYSKRLDRRLRHFLEYRLQNQFELGVLKHELNAIFMTIIEMTEQFQLGKPNTTKCLLGLTEEDPASDMMFELAHCRLLFRFMAFTLLLSVFVIFIEGVAARNNRHCASRGSEEPTTGGHFVRVRQSIETQASACPKLESMNVSHDCIVVDADIAMCTESA